MWLWMLDVFADTPTGNQYGPPSTSFSRAERLHPSGVRLRSARYARLRSASPRRGEDGGKKDNLQKQIYTNASNLRVWVGCRAIHNAMHIFIVVLQETTVNYFLVFCNIYLLTYYAKCCSLFVFFCIFHAVFKIQKFITFCELACSKNGHNALILAYLSA
jgi:hypothetical protein